MLRIFPKKRIWLIAVIFFLFFIALLFRPFSLSVKTLTIGLFKSPIYLVNAVTGEVKSIIFYRVSLSENLHLKNELSGLKEKLIKYQDLLAENERLKKILSIKSEAGYSIIIASVIARDAASWSDSIIIDKGSKNRISEGMAVTAPDGVVGKVQEVYPDFSKVSLISDPNFSVAAILQRSRQGGIVSGALSNNLMMRYLDKDADVKVGDLVLTSSISNIFPKGIPIGKVTSVGIDTGGFSLFAVIEPIVKLTALEEVMVILK